MNHFSCCKQMNQSDESLVNHSTQKKNKKKKGAEIYEIKLCKCWPAYNDAGLCGWFTHQIY